MDAEPDGSVRNVSRKQPAVTQSEDYSLRILNSIRRIIRAVDIDSRRLASAHHVTGPQLMCLMALGENSPGTAAEIARRIHLSSSTLVGVFDRLEAKGLVLRQRSADDRRQVSITLTESGQTLVASTPFPLQYSLGKAMAQLSADERRGMAECVERLVRLMGADEMDAGPMLEIIGVHVNQGATH